MISCLRLPSSAALMIIACHKRRLLDVLIGGQNKRILLDLVKTTRISSAVRDWLKAPDATISYNVACAKRHLATSRETVQPFNQQLNMLSSILTQCSLFSPRRPAHESRLPTYPYSHLPLRYLLSTSSRRWPSLTVIGPFLPSCM
jgi:hypothetical protein